MHGRAEANPNVPWLSEGLSCQRYHAANQRFTVDHSTFDGLNGADVLHDDPNVGGVLTGGHFQIGQQFNQLFRTAGRILGRNGANHNVFAFRGQLQRSNGFRFVVFDANDGQLRLQNMFDNPDAIDNLLCVFAHQRVIGGNVRFTLCGVDDKNLNAGEARLNLLCRGETRSAEARDPRIADDVDQLFGLGLGVVDNRMAFTPLVFAIWGDHHAQLA